MYDDIEFIEAFVERVKNYDGYLLTHNEQKHIIHYLECAYNNLNNNLSDIARTRLFKIRYDILCILKGFLIEDDDIIPEIFQYFNEKNNKKYSKQEILTLIQNEIIRYEMNYKKQKKLSNNKSLTNLFGMLNNKYNFEGFIHTTDFTNFINIMRVGYLYSRSVLEKNNIKYSDIALKEVIDNSFDKTKKYVRFYWRPKTPTNYDNEGIKPHKVLMNYKNLSAHSPIPVVMIFNSDIAQNSNVLFTSINASSSKVLYTNNLNDLQKFNWDNIFHIGGIEHNGRAKYEIILSKNAEFLYPDKVSTKNIKKIIFRSECDKERAVQLIGYNPIFMVDPSYFNNNFLYVKSYKLYNRKNNIKLNITYNLGHYLKYKYSLCDYEHRVKLCKNNKIISTVILNDQIVDGNDFLQNYYIALDIDIDSLIYYIDGIESLRINIYD